MKNKQLSDKSKKEVLMNLFKDHRIAEVARYGIVGVAGQLLGLAIFFVLIFLDFGISKSNIISYTLASSFTFVLHTIFSFKRPPKDIFLKTRIFNFMAACTIGAISSTAILLLAENVFNNIEFAKLSQLISAAAVQYIYNKFITFRQVRR